MSFESYLSGKQVVRSDGKYNFVLCGFNRLIQYTSQKYYIAPNEINYFYRRCCEFLSQDPDFYINFAQVMPKIAPLCLDFDIVVKYTNDYENVDHIYNSSDIDKIVEILNNIIYDNFKVDKENIKACVMEKAKYKFKNDEEIKDGLHVVYTLPFDVKHRWFIREQLLNQLKEIDLFGKYNITNTYEDIVDEAVIERNPWLTYKSVKAIFKKDPKNTETKKKKLELSKPYLLTRIINFNGFDEYTEDSYYSDEELMAIFNLEQFEESDVLEEKSEKLKAYEISSNKDKQKKPLDTKQASNNNQMSNHVFTFNNNSKSNPRSKFENMKRKINKYSNGENSEVEVINYQMLDLEDYKGKNKPKFTFEIFKRIVNILIRNEELFTNYQKWFEISCALYLHGKKNGLRDDQIKTLIFMFSENDPSFNKDKFETEDYPKIQKAAIKYKYGYGKFMNEIHFIDPIEENKIRNEIYKDSYKEMLKDCNDTDVADYLYESNKYNFLCTDTKRNVWYYFPTIDQEYNQQHGSNTEETRFIWEESLNAVCLHQIIDNLYRETKKRREKLYQYLLRDPESEPQSLSASYTEGTNERRYRKNSDDFERIKNIEKDTRIMRYNRLMKKLGNNGPQTAIVKTCTNRFYDKSIIDKLNENKQVICFNNGYFDFTDRKFKDPNSSIYSTFTTGYDYIDFSNPDELLTFYTDTRTMITKTCREIINDISQYMKTLITDPDDRMYMYKFCASLLSGEIREESMHIWSGSGSNGKSLFSNFLKNVMGDYYSTASTGIITQKRGNSSNANPEIANKKGKRVIVINEPENTDVIYVGRMKELTGQDIIEARALFSDPVYFKPQFRIIMICNHLPNISDYDQGTWRRMKIFTFNSKFHSKNNDPASHIFKINPKVEYLIRNNVWTAGFAWLLLNKYYEKFDNERLRMTPNMIERLNEFRNKNDEIGDFFNSNYEFVDPGYITLNYPYYDESTSENLRTDYIHWSNIYNDYQEWFHKQNGDSRKGCKSWKAVQDYINKYLEGCKIVKDEEDEEKYIIGLKLKEKKTRRNRRNDDEEGERL